MVEQWKPSRTGGNPSCEHYSSSPRTSKGEPYICTHTGECCYKDGHPTDHCIDCGLALPKEVIGQCKCGGTVVLWTTGVAFIGGQRIFSERCVKCGSEKHRTPTEAEYKAHGERHLASDLQRYEQMKANIAKFRK